MNKKDLNNKVEKDEQDLDSIFDNIKNTKLKKAIKRAQWQSVLRNVLISFLVMGVLLIGGSVANSSLNYRLEGPVQIAVDGFYEISAPNKYIGQSTRYHEFLGGRNLYTTYKLIEGKLVYTGQDQYSYGLFRNYQGNRVGTFSPLILGHSWDAEDLELQRYNELGQREMVFFYPFLEYSNYKNDFTLLDQIGSDKVMEMALSFDGGYTLTEVNKLLPDDITIAWYWIDDLSEGEKENTKPRTETGVHSDGTTYEIEYSPPIRSERTAYGIKAYNNNGQPLKDPIQHFIWALENGRKYDTRFKGEYERIFNNLAGADGQIDPAELTIMGVVVTGDAQGLVALEELPFIRAASLGVVTDRY